MRILIILILAITIHNLNQFYVGFKNSHSVPMTSNPTKSKIKKVDIDSIFKPTAMNRCNLNQPNKTVEIVNALPRKFKFSSSFKKVTPPLCLSLNDYRSKLYESLNIEIPKNFGKRKIRIAILDTGLDYAIPAFKNKIYKPGKDLPSNFYGVDLVNTNKEDLYFPKDNNGHGTHVAGIIIGLFPNAEILPIKYYNDEKTNSASLALAIRIAIKAEVNIINISGGGQNSDFEEKQAIEEAEKAGILIVAASGNDKTNLTNDKEKFYPASYQISNIISVMAHDPSGNKSSFSNYGKEFTDLMALGEIQSYVPYNKNKLGRCLGYMKGTSQATPFVTATAGILMAKNPTWSYRQVKDAILNSVDKSEDLKELTKSSGKLNISRTIASQSTTQIVAMP